MSAASKPEIMLDANTLARLRAKSTKRAERIRYIPLMPALIFLVIVTQIPFVVTIVISFFKWNTQYPDDTAFGWFYNYGMVLKQDIMRAAIWNTVVLVVLSVLISLALGTFLAMLLNRKFPGRGAARTLLITPFLIMPMASSLMWKHLVYNPDYGLLNGSVRWFWNLWGGDAPIRDWVSTTPMTAVIVALVWTWTPFMMLIVLAGLQAQDPSVIEAAMVDGATGWHRFRYITLPQLRPYMELALVLGIIYLLNTYDQVFAITQGGPGTATTNLPYAIYLTEFRKYDYGEAAAAGVIVVIMSIIVATFGLRLVSSLADISPSKDSKKKKKPAKDAAQEVAK